MTLRRAKRQVLLLPMLGISFAATLFPFRADWPRWLALTVGQIRLPMVYMLFASDGVRFAGSRGLVLTVGAVFEFESLWRFC